MPSGRTTTLLILAVALLLGVTTCAYAYIDPGTASTIWVAGIAPIIAFLGYIGQKIVRLFVRRKPDQTDSSADDAPTDLDD